MSETWDARLLSSLRSRLVCALRNPFPKEEDAHQQVVEKAESIRVMPHGIRPTHLPRDSGDSHQSSGSDGYEDYQKARQGIRRQEEVVREECRLESWWVRLKFANTPSDCRRPVFFAWQTVRGTAVQRRTSFNLGLSLVACRMSEPLNQQFAGTFMFFCKSIW